MNGNNTINICFDTQSIELGYSNEFSRSLIDFLFGDISKNSAGPAITRYDILAVGKQPMLSLWEGDRLFYFGQSLYQLAYILTNEIVYHCIAGNHRQHAIHAGAVSYGNHAIILPGKSGSGKSSLTARLLTRGFQYLTDELLLLNAEGKITPFTRPISLKGDQIKLFSRELTGKQSEVITQKNGSMIPHRLLNPDFSPQTPLLTHLIFPEFQKDAALQLNEISPAKSCLMLMESYVNARNHGGAGFSELSNIVRNCNSFKLVYGEFAGLAELFTKLFP